MNRSRLRSFLVSGDSMSPALRDGDRFLGWRAGRVRRGAVVAFPHPFRAGFWLVKRVVGLGGEVITIDTGEVMVDGRAGIDRWGQGWTAPDGEWRIPAGQLFVLSDQRPPTRDDSRRFGPVEATDLYRMILPPLYLRSRYRPPRTAHPRVDN